MAARTVIGGLAVQRGRVGRSALKVGVLGVLLACASTQAAAQTCEAEKAAMLAVNPRYRTELEYVQRHILEDMQVGSGFMDWRVFSCGTRCAGFGPRFTYKPDHPLWRELLLAYADYQGDVLNKETDTFQRAERSLNRCVASYLAKPRRAYQ